MRASTLSAALVAGAILAGGAARAHAEDEDFFAGFPSIRIGLGGGSGTTCGEAMCRDGGSISGVGSIGPSRGTGAWADLALHFAARDVCLGVGCGELPSTYALSAGVQRHEHRWYGAAGVGLAYSGTSFDRLWRYAHAVQASAVAGVEVWRGRDFEVSLEGRVMSSLAPFGELRMANLAVVVGNR